MKGKCTPEARRQLEALLETVRGNELHVRVSLAVELLEQIGTAEAVDLLRQLAWKTDDARIRDNEQAALRPCVVYRRSRERARSFVDLAGMINALA